MEWLEKHSYFDSRDGTRFTFDDQKGNVYAIDTAKTGLYESFQTSKGFVNEERWFQVIFAEWLICVLEKQKMKLVLKNRNEKINWITDYVSFQAVKEGNYEVYREFSVSTAVDQKLWDKNQEFFVRIIERMKEKADIRVWTEKAKYGIQFCFE